MPYAVALSIQEGLAAERARDERPDTLLLLEHPPTVTLGRRAGEEDLRWSVQELGRRGIAVERVARGGGATYHGPGQLVGYPIVRVGRRVRAWVAALEDVLADTAAAFGVRAERREGAPGLWAGEAKLASIGLEIRCGVSRHGFALNVDLDVEPFAGIVPCGMPGLRITDLSRESGRRVAIDEAAAACLRAWAARFGTIEEEGNELQRTG